MVSSLSNLWKEEADRRCGAPPASSVVLCVSLLPDCFCARSHHGCAHPDSPPTPLLIVRLDAGLPPLRCPGSATPEGATPRAEANERHVLPLPPTWVAQKLEELEALVKEIPEDSSDDAEGAFCEDTVMAIGGEADAEGLPLAATHEQGLPTADPAAPLTPAPSCCWAATAARPSLSEVSCAANARSDHGASYAGNPADDSAAMDAQADLTPHCDRSMLTNAPWPASSRLTKASPAQMSQLGSLSQLLDAADAMHRSSPACGNFPQPCGCSQTEDVSSQPCGASSQSSGFLSRDPVTLLLAQLEQANAVAYASGGLPSQEAPSGDAAALDALLGPSPRPSQRAETPARTVTGYSPQANRDQQALLPPVSGFPPAAGAPWKELAAMEADDAEWGGALLPAIEEIELSVPGLRNLGYGSQANDRYGGQGGAPSPGAHVACFSPALHTCRAISVNSSIDPPGTCEKTGSVIADSLERVLRQVRGVLSVAVSMRTESITVEAMADPGEADALHARLRAALVAVGLSVEHEDTFEEQVRSAPGVDKTRCE